MVVRSQLIVVSDAQDTTSVAAVAINWTILAFFLLEISMKVAGLGLQQFWASAWNKFDFFVVVLSTLMQVFLSILPVAVRVLTALSIVRFVRLVRVVRAYVRCRGLEAAILILCIQHAHSWSCQATASCHESTAVDHSGY